MITRRLISRRTAVAFIAALTFFTVDGASGQSAPESSRRIIRRVPGLTKATEVLVRARAAAKAQNLELAYTEFGVALKLAPKTGPEHDEALRGFSENGVALAQQRLKDGRAPEAQRIAREVLATNPDYRPALEVLAQIKPAAREEPTTIVPRPPTITRIQPQPAPTTRLKEKAAPRPTPPLPAEQPPTTAEPPETTAPEKKALVKVYFATDREHVDGAAGPSNYFGTARNPDRDPDGQHLVTGVVTVSIPPVHEAGQLERPFKWWIIEFKEDEKKHIVLKELSVMDANDFYGALRNEYEARTEENRSAFVFIHGFKTNFDDAAYRTAQLAYDLNFEGVPIMYSWPSKDNLLAYATDRETADWSWRHLQYFVERIARESGALRIHLIAHSMGNQLLVNALDGLGRQPEIKPLFDNVVMAAPDVDAKTFQEHDWDAIRDAAKRFTLYASSEDWALKVSRELRGGTDFVRLGEAGGALVVIPGLDTIDASGIDTNELGHSYYHCKKLMDDLQLLMTKGWAPLERHLRNQPKGDLAYWAFP